MSIDSQALTESSSGIGKHVREIVSHGGIFALGLLLTRLTSVVLLPVYTRMLTPADYGVLTILDIVGELLRLAIGTGLTSAASRFHFDTNDEAERSKVWWVALFALLGFTTLVALPVLLASASLSKLSLGAGVPEGSRLYALMLSALWFALPESLFQNHLRAIKQSRLLVGLGLARLAVNAALNILLLYQFRLGVTAVLLGNLVTTLVWAVIHLVLFARVRGVPVLDWKLLPSMFRFGGPLVGVALMSLAMHQIDRYILVGFVSLSDIGIYSLAYQIGQGVNSLVLSPFSQVWGVVVFEVAALRDFKRLFAEIFSTFVRGLSLVLLAAALGSRLAVAILAPPSYAPAADLIPVIALAYFFFSLDDHFRVPALLQKRTGALLPVYAIAAVTNVGLNLLLVPRWGIEGAAWASAGTFATFSAAGLAVYRKLDRIDYGLLDGALVVGSAVLAYVLYRWFLADRYIVVSLLGSLAMWAALLVAFSRRPLRAWRALGAQAASS